MDELAHCLPASRADDKNVDSDKENGVTNGNGHLLTNKLNTLESQMKRAVKFNDDEEVTIRKEPLTLPRRPSRGPNGRRASLSMAVKPLIEGRQSASDEQWIDHQFVRFSPKDELSLRKVDGESDLIDVVAIKNTTSGNIMFKIKTTSPEKFRVRPSAGNVAIDSTESVRVYLQHEYRYSCSKEKFLILAMETDETNADRFGEAWKLATNKVEQKMRCKISDDCVLGEAKERKSGFLADQQEAARNFHQQIIDLQNSSALLMKILAVLIVFLIIVFYYDRANYASLQMKFETISQEHKSILAQFAQRLQTIEDQPRIIINNPPSIEPSTAPLPLTTPTPAIAEPLPTQDPYFNEDL